MKKEQLILKKIDWMDTVDYEYFAFVMTNMSRIEYFTSVINRALEQADNTSTCLYQSKRNMTNTLKKAQKIYTEYFDRYQERSRQGESDG